MKHPVWLGIDFGWRNPFGAVFGVPVRGGEQWLIVAEYKQELRRVSEHGRKILEINFAGDFGALAGGWADPSDPEGIDELSEVLGVRILPAPAIGVKAGQEIVERWFREGPYGPGVIIHPRCVELIREIGFYDAHNPGGGDHHLLDGLRYLLVGSEGKR
jgi:hypothetical protein